MDGQDAAVLAHQLLRRESAALPQRVRSVDAGDVARARAVTARVGKLLDSVFRHQRAEDEFLWPVLRPRLDPDAGVIERVQEQRQRITSAAEAAAALVARWRRKADESIRTDLAIVLDGLSVALAQHLDDEESRVLPLAARTLTPDQWRSLRHALNG